MVYLPALCNKHIFKEKYKLRGMVNETIQLASKSFCFIPFQALKWKMNFQFSLLHMQKSCAHSVVTTSVVHQGLLKQHLVFKRLMTDRQTYAKNNFLSACWFVLIFTREENQYIVSKIKLQYTINFLKLTGRNDQQGHVARSRASVITLDLGSLLQYSRSLLCTHININQEFK